MKQFLDELAQARIPNPGLLVKMIEDDSADRFTLKKEKVFPPSKLRIYCKYYILILIIVILFLLLLSFSIFWSTCPHLSSTPLRAIWAIGSRILKMF